MAFKAAHAEASGPAAYDLGTAANAALAALLTLRAEFTAEKPAADRAMPTPDPRLRVGGAPIRPTRPVHAPIPPYRISDPHNPFSRGRVHVQEEGLE